VKGLNKVTLIGHLGKDPEVLTLEKNIKVAKLTLATSETFKDDLGKKHTVTDWHNVVLWRSLADVVEKYCHKGSMIYLEGKLKTRSYKSKDGDMRYVTEVIAEEIILLDKKSASSHG
jgi:single-strand DNA-binding protein